MDWSPQQQTSSDDSRGATPVVGTVLLIGVVVVISATVGVTVMDYPSEVEPTSVTVDDEQCQSVEFDPEDVDRFADDRSDCASGGAAGGPYRGAVMWFDAGQEGFSSGGESVDRWTDRSGNGYDAVVARGDPQGYADVDGVAAVEFERSGFINPRGDVFTAEATTAEANLDGDTEFAVSVVIQPDGSFGNYLAVGNNNTGTFTGQATSTAGQNLWTVYNSTVDEDGTHTSDTTTSPVPHAEPWTVVTYTYNETSVSLYVNGELRDQDKHDDIELDMHGDITVGGVPAGGPLDFTGAIGELVIYDHAIDDAQRETLECGFDEKYGSAVSVTGC